MRSCETAEGANIIFSDADVKIPLASVSAIVDEANVVGPQVTYLQSTSIGFVVQLDARENPKEVEIKKPNESGQVRGNRGSRAAGVNATRMNKFVKQNRRNTFNFAADPRARGILADEI